MKLIKHTRDGQTPGWTLFKDLTDDFPESEPAKMKCMLELLKDFHGTDLSKWQSIASEECFPHPLAPPLSPDLLTKLRIAENTVEHTAVT